MTTLNVVITISVFIIITCIEVLIVKNAFKKLAKRIEKDEDAITKLNENHKILFGSFKKFLKDNASEIKSLKIAIDDLKNASKKDAKLEKAITKSTKAVTEAKKQNRNYKKKNNEN